MTAGAAMPGVLGLGTATVVKNGGAGGTDLLQNVNEIRGSSGADSLAGFSGTYSYQGMRLRGGAGNDTIQGFKSGSNTADYSSATGAVGIDLQQSTDGKGNWIGSAAGDASVGTDMLVSVTHVRASNYDDTVMGGQGDDVLDLLAAGSHVFHGRAGLNEVRFAVSAATPVVIDLGTTASGTGFGGYQGFVSKPGGLTDTLYDVHRAQGGGGNDTVYGTPDDDTLAGGAGSNLLDGRTGSNTVSYRPSGGQGLQPHGAVIDLTDGIAGTAANPWDGTDTLQNIQHAIGTQLDDTITGADLAGGGVSIIRGDGGNDLLQAAHWGDRVVVSYASSLSGVTVDLVQQKALDDGWFGGQDVLANIQAVRGSGFADSLLGGDRADTLDGADGADTLAGGNGQDSLAGGAGADSLAGGAGNDTLLGEDGDDVLVGGLGADSLVGGTGLDTVSYAAATAGVTASLSSPGTNAGEALGDSFSGIENLRGSAFTDRLVAAAGANRLEGLAGDDQLIGGSGADTLDGGAGTGDIASYENAATGVTASLAAPGSNTGDAAGDVYLGIEALRGSSHADSLAGDAGSNKLIGLAGNDTLSGGDGSDTLIGGLGADVLVGGNNSDTASYEAAAAGVAVFLLAPAGNTGEAAGDTYSGVENLRGSAFADRLVAGAGPNMLEGLDGNDTLEGGSGGDDRLIGGAGADRLVGGIGADTFVYKVTGESTALAPDVIADFVHTQADRIDLSAIDARPGLAGDQAFAFLGTAAFTGGGIGSVRTRQDGGDTYVEVDTGDGTANMVIRLTGFLTLAAADFVL